MNSTNLIIIARYEEDITWAKDVEGDVIIYNKGNDWPWKDIPRVESENYGREGETFVRGIIEFYDNLENYDNLVFLQGNPFEHCADFIKYLSADDKKNIIKLSDYVSSDHYPTDNYIFGKHLSIINLLLQINDKSFSSNIKDCNPNNDTDSSNTDFFLFEEVMGLCSILNIEYKDKTIEWANGAQYIVPVEKIKSKSKDWWINLHSIFFYLSRNKKIESWTYALERMWPLIWDYQEQ